MILTSNRTRELHDALKRRCLYHWIGHPSVAREIEIVELRVPGRARTARGGGCARSLRSCASLDLQKPPGLAETIDWVASAAPRSASRSSTSRTSRRRSASLLKYHEDVLAIRDDALAGLVASSAWLSPRTPSSGMSSSSGGCCGRAASRSARGASRTRCAASTPSTWRAARTSTGRCGRRSSRATRTSRPSTVPSTRGSCASPARARFDLSMRRRTRTPSAARAASPGPGPEVDGGTTEAARWSADEFLRSRDFAAMTPDEFARARRLIAELAVDRPRRRTRRLRPDRRGNCARRPRPRARLARDGRRPGRALRFAAGRRRRASSS